MAPRSTREKDRSWGAAPLRLLGIAALAGAAALVTGCGGSAGPAKAPSPSATDTGSAQQTAHVVRLKVVGHEEGRIGPDGLRHDTLLPANFTVRAGVPTRVVITNHDEMAHSITVPGLGINQTIAEAKDEDTPSTTTSTLVVNKTGKFRWYCALPCDDEAAGWAMTAGKDGPSRNGFMAGFITAD